MQPMKPKILILGSDIGTIDIAIEAKKMGLYVITSDLMESSPTKECSDEAWLISTNDLPLLTEKCIANGISGVLAGVSEFNAGCAHQLAKNLGLPVLCKNEEAWAVGRNKYLFKQKSRDYGVPVADDYILTDELLRDDLDKINYPVVVKPVDKSGNRGMSYCYDEEELIAAYRKARECSDYPYIICERMLCGQEYNANYVLCNGEARLLYFSALYNEPGEPANLYSMMVTTCRHLNKWNEEVHPYLLRFIKESGFENGIVWFENFMDSDGHFYLIDPAYRLSSESSYALFEKVSGFNAIKWLIEDAIGIKHNVDDMPQIPSCSNTSCVAGYHLFASQDGIISSIVGLDIISSIDAIVLDMPKRENTQITKHRLMGVIKIYADSIDLLIEKIKIINEYFSINDKFGNNLFIRFDDYYSLRRDFIPRNSN